MPHELLRRLERNPAASDQALRELADFAGVALPADYIAFLSESDGASGWPHEELYLQLWAAKDVIKTTQATLEWAWRAEKRLLFFGGDGSREMFCFDLATEGPDVLLLDITYASTAASPWRIAGFTALLEHLSTNRLFDPPLHGSARDSERRRPHPG